MDRPLVDIELVVDELMSKPPNTVCDRPLAPVAVFKRCTEIDTVALSYERRHCIAYGPLCGGRRERTVAARLGQNIWIPTH